MAGHGHRDGGTRKLRRRETNTETAGHRYQRRRQTNIRGVGARTKRRRGTDTENEEHGHRDGGHGHIDGGTRTQRWKDTDTETEGRGYRDGGTWTQTRRGTGRVRGTRTQRQRART